MIAGLRSVLALHRLGSSDDREALPTPDAIDRYIPFRPIVITRRRLAISSAIAASTNGVMSR